MLDLRNRISRDVRTSWLNANTAFNRLAVTQQLLDQSNLALDLSGRRYKVGIRIQNALAGLRSCDVCIVCCLWSVDAESVVSHNAIEDRLYACLSFTFLLSVSQSCCASEFRTFVNVSVNVPLDAPLGTAKSTVTLAVSDPDVSVTDDGTTVHVEFGGPPLQVRLMVPWNPVVDDSVSIKTAMWPGGMLSVVGETAIVKSPTLRFAEAYCPFRHWSRSHCRWCWCIAQLPLRLQSR